MGNIWSKSPPRAGWKKKSSIVKIVALVFTTTVYGLFISYQSYIAVAYERLLYTTVFSGFAILYIVLVMAVFAKQEIDKVLNAVWAFYATCAYLALGIFLVARYHHSTNYLGLADGLVAMITSLVTLLDCVLTSLEK